ncbi:hypothetical protein QBC47DRAFT_214516 [Echria macrotheca]|uniref:Uncharacterized protein n=1 Tax=Echria macrotheca TaxID=438768 RepID=A0AAJ0BBP5_9PEZI|nr:hypothetical protein QBC47DRAFT_214516 [Echria macrotheca]
MPNLWKPGRAKSGRKSIRGTISAPIPIASSLEDDEFPIRNPGSTKAMISPDDEFPIRRPGTGIASPVPPPELDDAEFDPEKHPEPPALPKQQSPEPSEEKTDSSEQESPQAAPEAEPASHSKPESEHGGDTDPDPVPDIQPEAPSHPPPAPPEPAAVAEVANERPISRASPPKNSPQRISPQRVSPLRTRTSPSLARNTNPPISMARYSMMSESPSGHTGQSKDGPQRKKSSLRSALGRLFGRGRKKNGSSRDLSTGTASGRESGMMGSSQHRSDPSALSQSKERSPKRSASLPLTEYDRPLRSHSIGPEDIMAIESARNSLQAESGGAGASANPGRRRAATAGSRMLLQPRIRNMEWGAGLSPRPASTHGRSNSRLAVAGEPEDPNEIGRAITSDSGNGARRRSRSLSGLQDLVAQPGGRRRSDEIRFWRESYDPGFMSPLSSNPQEDMDIDDTGMLDASAPESPAVERPPRTPPQPFDFNIPKTMVGMKITQVASIDSRLDGLESRANRLERVVDQLCHAVPGFKGPLGESNPVQGEALSFLDDHATSSYTTAPPAIPSISKTIAGDLRGTPRYASSHRSIETADSHSQISFGDAPTFIGSLHPPSSSATQSQSLAATAPPPLISPLHRPTSTSTVRGTASLPTMGRAETNSNEDAYASLVAQLETERAARQALEAQVRKLSERLNTLSTTMFAMVRGPSESRSQERLTPSLGGNSPLLQPPKLPVPPSTQVLKNPSGFETDDDDEQPATTKEVGNAKVVVEADDDNDDALTTDDFQTPREEQPPLSYGAFGEELRPDDDDDEGEADSTADDPKRRKAARTLSLSQLTLGKGQRTQI